MVQRHVEHRPDGAPEESLPQAPSVHQHQQLVCEPALEAEHWKLWVSTATAAGDATLTTCSSNMPSSVRPAWSDDAIS